MRKLSLAFATDGEPFTGNSPEEQALGGSETALVQAARAMAARAHRVQVFCRCTQPGLYNGVLYRDRQDIVKAIGEERFDALIVSRFFPILDLPWQAGVRIIWNHDTLDNPAALQENLADLDAVLVLSRFHAANFIGRLPAVANKLALTRNGLDLSLLARASQGVSRVPGKLTYVSRPERGLKPLLSQIWPRLLQEMPHLSLSICGYQINEDELPAALKDEYQEIHELIKNAPQVEFLGPLPKERYYAHLASCQALLYPCIFPEISCLAVLEAQALGTPVITSNDFALQESVVIPEFKVEGQPGSERYVENYLAACRNILGNPELAARLGLEAQRQVHLRYDWSSVVEEWEELIFKLRRQQEMEQNDALCASLILSGDRRPARQLYQKPLPPPPGDVPEVPPPDPDEMDLLNKILDSLGPCLRSFINQGTIGFVEPDSQRTLKALRPFLPGCKLVTLKPGEENPHEALIALVIRDQLERSAKPHELLQWAVDVCRPDGWLSITVASGAWPLISHGYMHREYDLGREDIIAMLPGRPLFMNYLPRGLVGRGVGRMAVGRWLALTKTEGPAPSPLLDNNHTRWVRPAEKYILTEVYNAGLL